MAHNPLEVDLMEGLLHKLVSCILNSKLIQLNF